MLGAKKNKINFFFLTLTGIILFICKLEDFLYYLFSKCIYKLNDNYMDWEIGIYIIFTFIFCKIINKEITLYIHHKVAIIITLIPLVLMSSIDIYSLFREDQKIQFSNKLIYIILNTSFCICYPFSNSLFTILMNNYLTPIVLMFWIGIFGAILFVILFPILYLTNVLKLGAIEFDNFTLFIIIKIVYIILTFIKFYFYFKVINRFSPTYMLFMCSIKTYCSFIARLFLLLKGSSFKGSILCIIINFISLIIVSFGALLFNEIIIIHKFGLDKKTKLFLSRFSIEELYIEEDDDNCK